MSFNWPWLRDNKVIWGKGSEPMRPVEGPPPFHATLESVAIEATARLDTYSGTWIYIRDYLQKSLQDLRESNDSVNKDDLQTAVLRGQIKMAKKILELPNPKPKFMEQDADEENEF